MRRALALVVLTALVTGCAGAAEDAAPAATTPAGPAPAAAPPREAAQAEAAPPPAARVLYLTAEGGLSEAAPDAPAHVPLADQVNGPWAEGYPEWEGALPWNATSGDGRSQLTLYVTSNVASASVGAVFPFPDIVVRVTFAAEAFEVPVDAPDVLLANEVAEIVVPLPLPLLDFAAGAAVRVTPIVYYTHVRDVAEFRYVISPDHPARLELTG